MNRIEIQQKIESGDLTVHKISRINDIYQILDIIRYLSTYMYNIPTEKIQLLYQATRRLIQLHLKQAKIEPKKISAITTKVNDSGPRSAPWQAYSSQVPGRPQDGQDGNRINRWELPKSHKFFATEVNAKLVGVKYFFQILSMKNAPPLPPNTIQQNFNWLLYHPIISEQYHPIIPGKYIDPIQLTPLDFETLINSPREIESGHLTPLDRGGRHIPDNAFLMGRASNRIQNNMTIEELLQWLEEVLRRYKPQIFK